MHRHYETVRTSKRRGDVPTPASTPCPNRVVPAILDHDACLPPRRARQPRRCTVGFDHYPGRDRYRGDDEVPSLRLRGLWLEALGFTVGTRLRNTAEAGLLTLTVDGAET